MQRKHLYEELKQGTGRIVQDGPFKGMKLPDRPSWGDGDYISKLLGFYEAELHPLIYKSLEIKYDCLVNIGCSEGYYAIGYALLSKTAQVFAFDSSPEAQRACKICAEENGIPDKVRIGETIEASDLQNLLSKCGKSLLIVDCEGYELHLMRPELVPALENADFIVECHNFSYPTMASTLAKRFEKTHKTTILSEGHRNPHSSQFLQNRHSLIRWLAVCEGRWESMEWLCGMSLKRYEPATTHVADRITDQLCSATDFDSEIP
jgi:hypothetical protein